ncbi:MAG: tRNA (adenosine(37)-N6)-threonylcarbamoyltransferase complex dimerization subunit type 1 TsaB [Deltaproteobacteria bacterium]|nr:tRNA (adenosine(37)-N6)-threonylcarbamoyltransferase complex dimerization subunit type 1 TsaB [Deltaproteobacteria bacterium]
MRILALDCSSAMCSACLTEDETVLAEVSLRAFRSHATFLYRCVDQLMVNGRLGFEDLHGFAVTIGPGSFTGLRIGVAAAKGLAYASGKPLVGVSTLEALAGNIPYSRLPLVAALDARKNQLYAARFGPAIHGETARIGPDRVLSPEDRIAECRETDTLFVGDGALRYRTLLKEQLGGRAVFAPATAHHVRSPEVARLALGRISSWRREDLFGLSPNYIRRSEAEIGLDTARGS